MSDLEPVIAPLGDRALRFPIPAHLDRRTLLATLRAAAGIADVILAEDIGAAALVDGASAADATTAVHSILTAPALSHVPVPVPVPVPDLPAHHIIRVIYDGADLPDLAARLSLTTDDVISLHTGREYEVAMLGFMPGFAYLRGLDPRLVVERRAEPRPRVPAGSVAIAAGYTGIYPFASPGGWHILGEAVDHRPFDAATESATLSIGDRVRFERAQRVVTPPSNAQPSASTPEAIAPPPAAHLEVRKAQGPALVVDGGRVGHMHEGVPHGGPMVPEALAVANAAAGNRDAGAAAIEVYGVLEVVARGGAIAVGDDASGGRVLADGEAYVVATEGRTRVRYLAVRGGIDVPVVLGGRGTMLGAGIGGYLGRALRRGDRIAGGEADRDAGAEEIGHGHGHGHVGEGEREAETVVAILDGPDGDEAVLAAMDGATFGISAMSDRTGTRLAVDRTDPALPSMQTARDRKSMPMVRGAIEMTPTGLVVLGPDHPTTGGYPVVAVVRSDAIGLFFSVRIGGLVRLVRSAEKPT